MSSILIWQENWSEFLRKRLLSAPLEIQSVQQAQSTEEYSSVKLLTKNKALELRIDTYSWIIGNISNVAKTLMSSDYPKSKQIKNRDKQVNRELNNFGEQSQGEIEIHKPQITEVCTKDSKPLAKKHEKKAQRLQQILIH